MSDLKQAFNAASGQIDSINDVDIIAASDTVDQKNSSTVTIVNPVLRENLSKLPLSTPNGSKPDKLYYIAHELYTTERDYVDVLRMLTVEFREAIKPHVPDWFLKEFFSPLNQVLPANEHLLRELSDRVLHNWDAKPMISGICLTTVSVFVLI